MSQVPFLSDKLSKFNCLFIGLVEDESPAELLYSDAEICLCLREKACTGRASFSQTM